MNGSLTMVRSRVVNRANALFIPLGVMLVAHIILAGNSGTEILPFASILVGAAYGGTESGLLITHAHHHSTPAPLLINHFSLRLQYHSHHTTIMAATLPSPPPSHCHSFT